MSPRGSSNQPDGDAGFASVFANLQEHRALAAWVAFVVLAASTALKPVVPQVFPVAAVIYLSVITGLLVNMHRHATGAPTVFASHQAASVTFLEEITRAIHGRGRCELVWIGVTLQSAWLTLENALGRELADRHLADVSIRLLQSDPDFLQQLLGQDSTQAKLTHEQAEHICRFASSHSEAMRQGSCTIELAQYAYMPNYHGLLVNGEVLYLATVRWGGEAFEELNVPTEPFERFDRSTERGRYMIDLYMAWLEHGTRTASKLHTFPERPPLQEIAA
jgi:hypothetical protein